MAEKPINVVILGAAGRDFHNFLQHFKDNPKYKVVCFTQAQIPGISQRFFPKEMAGELYKLNIPFYPEVDLAKLVKRFDVDLVVLAYSDLPYDFVMHKASEALSLGCDFELLGPKSTMVKSKKPLISVCAVRTGCGKSQTTRYVAGVVKKMGKKIAVIRHPMPYGDLKKQEVQRFAEIGDLKKHNCTIEEMEEYEPHIREGNIVYAGVDYEKILRQAEEECDVVLWDGGNNDFSFYRSDLLIVVADAHRPGHEVTHYPGEVNLRMADVVLINKVDTAETSNVDLVAQNVSQYNPLASVLQAESPIQLHPDTPLNGKRVLVIEDGPTLTHGGMKYGAGFIIARERGATIVNPNLYAKGEIKKVLEKFELEQIVPAMGYTPQELDDLQRTINSSACDFVVDGSPINLGRVLKGVKKPILQVQYDLKVLGDLDSHIEKVVR